MTPSGTLTEHAADNGLHPAADRAVALLVATAHELWDSVLVGNPAPKVAERYRRMTAPQLGDWVLVNHVGRDVDPYLRVGRWTGWWEHLHWFDDADDLEFAEREGRPPYASEEVFGLELIDGQRMNWTNVSLLTLPPYPRASL